MCEPRIWFFAGGDHGKGAPNLFTASFIRLMTETYNPGFRVIEGIYNRYPFLNVFWALGHAQCAVKRPESTRILNTSYRQIISDWGDRKTELFLVSSSYGSVVAAQSACYLAREILAGGGPRRSFHLAIGASMVSKKSKLFHNLLSYQEQGIIGQLIYDELQDEGDNSNGIGGTNRWKAYLNALGICFPYLTRKYRGPSFLNKNPRTGHLHRRRAQTQEKAEVFLRVVKKMVAG